jgi:hypothetical protein
MLYELPLVVISVPNGLPEVVPVQLTLYGAVPPVAVIDAEPFVNPKHVTLVGVLDAVNPEGSIMTTCVVATQPLTSVTVTSYVPAPNAVML